MTRLVNLGYMPDPYAKAKADKAYIQPGSRNVDDVPTVSLPKGFNMGYMPEPSYLKDNDNYLMPNVRTVDNIPSIALNRAFNMAAPKSMPKMNIGIDNQSTSVVLPPVRFASGEATYKPSQPCVAVPVAYQPNTPVSYAVPTAGGFIFSTNGGKVFVISIAIALVAFIVYRKFKKKRKERVGKTKHMKSWLNQDWDKEE